jgi:hypothetical protein
MTAAQKLARVKFNKAIAIRKKTGCTLKEAFAQVYSKKVSAAPKKTAVKKKVGALPIGFKGNIWGVPFKIVNQYNIYGEVSAICEDTTTGSTIVTFDGTTSADKLTEQFYDYILRHRTKKYSYSTLESTKLKSTILKFCKNMQKEVKDFNAGKKKTIKKQPLIIKEPKEVKKVAPKKTAVKKSAIKKKASKPHTKWGKIKSHERRVAGMQKRKVITEKAILNKIHKVKKDVDHLDEAQHKHMMGGKLSLSQQIGKIKMGSTFIYYKGFSIERMELTIKDKKKKLPVFIVHELNQTYKTLSDAKRMIDFLAR